MIKKNNRSSKCRLGIVFDFHHNIHLGFSNPAKVIQ